MNSKNSVDNIVHGINWIQEKSLESLNQTDRLIAVLSMLGIKSATARFMPLAYYDSKTGYIMITCDGANWITMSGAV